MQAYYFEIEKREDNAVTFAYIWKAEDDATTAPPVKSFHSMLSGDEAEKKVSNQAAKWILAAGGRVGARPPVRRKK